MLDSGSPLRRRLSLKRVTRSVEKLCSMFFFRLPDHDPTESESRQRMDFDLRRSESKDFDLLSRIDGALNRRVSGKDWAGVSQGSKRNAQKMPIGFITLMPHFFMSTNSTLFARKFTSFHLPLTTIMDPRLRTISPPTN